MTPYVKFKGCGRILFGSPIRGSVVASVPPHKAAPQVEGIGEREDDVDESLHETIEGDS